MNVDIRSISLCSGGAGLDQGLALVCPARTVCWVEWEAFAIDYLVQAMEAGCLAQAPVWTDLRTFDGLPWRGTVDCITAGYPCQPFSLAGKRRGQDDPRHLWPHVRRIIGEVQPALVFLENVPGHLSLGFAEAAADLEGLGYEVAAGLFTAEEVGASHRRERLFIVAQSNLQSTAGENGRTLAHASHAGLSDAQQPGLPATSQRGLETRAAVEQFCFPQLFPPRPDEFDRWREVLEIDNALAPAQPAVRLLADGLAEDRAGWLRLLGNGVVPLQAAYAFVSLWSCLKMQHI